jgi:chemotaxis methyl-accepting protein methylase
MEALVGPVFEHISSGSTAGKLKINVFAGSSGAEAFTIASVLMRCFPGLDFEIDCSDLHRDKIDEAESGLFTWMQITQGLPIPEQFMEETFDRVGEAYSVKPSIRERVTFSQADIVNDNLEDLYEKADIICAQNVFCHLDLESSQKAFRNILKLAKEKAAIFIDGMDPDLRITLTTEAGLHPLDFRCREIYEYARKHLSFNWWKYYYGREPYLFFKKDKLRRYGTIFFVESPRLSA